MTEKRDEATMAKDERGKEGGMDKITALRATGFRPLRDGKINLRCPRCGRKQSNTEREPFDPKNAVLAEIFCDKCGAGGKDSEVTYFDEQGREIEWRGD